ncbi:MAG TPA: hypothetical protein VGJ28_15755 [Micromonosporaceae bacterium]|jgi:hypothetical protein
MAVMYKATIEPTKLELLAAWLPTRSWFSGSTALERIATFRFDDPDGQVGVETMLVRAGDGPLFQTPMTYRAALLAGAEDFLIGTTEHSRLGHRWVYDACGDPIYATALANTILTGGRSADEFYDDGETVVPRQPRALAAGTGTHATDSFVAAGGLRTTDGDPTIMVIGDVELSVARIVGHLDGTADLLTARWDGSDAQVVLATARLI